MVLGTLLDLDESECIIAVSRTDGRFLFANAAACRHFGIGPHHVREYRLAEFERGYAPTPDAPNTNENLIAEHSLFGGARVLVTGRRRNVTVGGVPVMLGTFHPWNERDAMVVSVPCAERGHPSETGQEEASIIPGCLFTCIVDDSGRIAMPFLGHGALPLIGLRTDVRGDRLGAVEALMNEADRDTWRRALEWSARTEHGNHTRFCITHHRKGPRWIEAQFRCRRKPGAAVVIDGFMQEVAEPRESDTMRKSREQEFKSAVENSPDTVARYDCERRGIYANRKLLTMLAIDDTEFIGRTPLEVNGDQSGELLNARIEEVIATGREDEFVDQWPSPSGAAWIQVRLVPERDFSGRVTSVLALGRDISLLKESERVLEQSRSRLRRLAAYQEVAQERERKRIVEEMHEEVAQVLAVLGWELKHTHRVLDASDPRRSQLARMGSLVDRALGSVLATVNAIRPPVLETDIVPALRRLAERLEAEHGVPCQLVHGGVVLDIGGERSATVYRLTEALLGAALSAPGAELAEIHFEQRGDHYFLRVDARHEQMPWADGEDDIAFLMAQECALRLGGECIMFDPPGGGRSVELMFPASKN